MTDYIQVPVEPTPEMMKAFCVALKAVTTEEWEDPLYADQVAEVLKSMPPAYRAMLDAAPDHIADARKMVAPAGQGEPSYKELYREFSEWCQNNRGLDMDCRLHTHGGPIDHGGYISDEKTRVAFAAYRAGRLLARQPTEQQPAPYVAGLIICDECHAKCSEPYTGLFASHCPDEEPCIMCECSSLRRRLASRSGVQVEPDVEGLVEALEQCITSMLDSGYRANAVVIRAARAALSAHRKGGEA